MTIIPNYQKKVQLNQCNIFWRMGLLNLQVQSFSSIPVAQNLENSLKLVITSQMEPNSKLNSLIGLHHTSNHSVYTRQYNYNLSSNMDKVAQLNQSLGELVPIYGSIYNFLVLQINQSIQTFNKLYKGSTERVTKARKVSNRFNKQAVWLLSESAEQLLDLAQYKLKIIHDQTSDMKKTTRLLKIVSQLKEEYLMNPMRSTLELNQTALNWIKSLPEKYILPLYFTLKATIVVSRQIMMEMLAERLGQLKMSYEVSKDTVTMIFAGEFDQKKILEKVSTKFNDFKQITINFVKKGMEIKISKSELRQNFLTFADKIVETVREVSEKSVEEWGSAKLRTMTLYNSVLNRIKEKEIVIKTEYFKKPEVGLEEEATSLLEK